MNTYTTKMGDTLDLVCHTYYQQQATAIERVLKVNQHLVNLPIILPVGTVINLPAIAKKIQNKKVALW
jgi:phage tail protein X